MRDGRDRVRDRDRYTGLRVPGFPSFLSLSLSLSLSLAFQRPDSP
jgi:hypothetical protein